MMDASACVQRLHTAGFGLFSGVPCSYLKPLINQVIDSDTIRYVGATNEGDAVAIASGAALGGLGAVALMQNSGLGNAVSPLTSLNHVFRIPILLLITLRGEPGGPADEPQHELMGAITTAQLELMQIAWRYLPNTIDALDAALSEATDHMQRTGRPFAFVVRKDTIAPYALAARNTSCRSPGTVPSASDQVLGSRRDALKAIQSGCSDRDVVIASTGYSGRELYALDDRHNQIYMVGSMGCASSLGLGLAIARPQHRIVVIDGDGALLMRMGALATIGYEQPDNLLHIVLDNGMHESTGGQSTVSGTVDLVQAAAACGYPAVFGVDSLESLTQRVASRDNRLTFLHGRIRPGVPDQLPRPTITPAAVAARLRDHLGVSVL